VRVWTRVRHRVPFVHASAVVSGIRSPLTAAHRSAATSLASVLNRPHALFLDAEGTQSVSGLQEDVFQEDYTVYAIATADAT